MVLSYARRATHCPSVVHIVCGLHSRDLRNSVACAMTGRPAPRPKRAGEEFARSNHADPDDNRASKKVRFDTRNPAALAADAPEDDAFLDADEIGRRGAQTKRSAINIDGYESDSSHEGFDGRANAKAKAAKHDANGSKDEDEDDMFADVEEKQFPDGDEDEELAKSGKNRRDVNLVDIDQVADGQVSSSRSGGHLKADILAHSPGKDTDDVESVSSEDDDEAEARRAALAEGMDEELGAGGKKQHAPRLEAFNLAEEKEEGGFDEQQNYVRKAADPDAVYDNWLEGTNKKDVRQAKEAHERRQREQRAKDKEDDEVLMGDILRNLIPHIEKGETVLEALARLGRGKPKSAKVPKWKAKKKATEMDVDADEPEPAEDDAETKRRLAVEAITDSADRLMKRGHEDIYEDEREILTRLYKRETGEEWVDDESKDNLVADPDAMWEYRWADARDGGTTHGPYDGITMNAWNGAGYFGEGVEFRTVGSNEGAWTSAAQFI